MMTIDTLLLKILNFTDPAIEENISHKDCRVLRSIAQTIDSGLYITENQSKLVVKIIRENAEKITNFTDEIKSSLLTPSWSRSFRHVEQIKKIFIDKDEEGDLRIVVEFSFNTEIRKILSEITKKYEDINIQINGKKYILDLTEKNVVALIDELSKFNFDIEDTLKNYYNTIKSWSELEVKDQFLITKIEHKNFQKAITDDLGLSTTIDQNIINDRGMRYQYTTQIIRNYGESLTEVIANRSKTRIYIDKKQHSISNIISSLIELKRLPLLVVFDNVVNNKYLENLKILSEGLENNGITDGIGIYFRLPNDDMGKKFNTLIAEKHYNNRLDDFLKVAVVMSGKLPKFFLTNTWRPMSVIALDSRMGLRHGKTSIYSNCCDCIVEWSDEPVMIDKKIHFK
jgi:hypothetical protein